MVVSNSRLLGIAAFTGVACVSGSLYCQYKIQEGLKKGDYYKKSLDILKQHNGAMQLLGPPIKQGNLDLGDTVNNMVDGYRANLAIPVQGQKQKGKLFLWAEREKPGDSWNVQKLELSLENSEFDGRRLLVYKSKNNDQN
ncbi:cytochrome c oxidase assembly factor 1 homolog isoform X2 [Tachypleus tridentatus]|uniref:cytochrome c oxidase assembly factor 1 homolog isoform X2 n=1 Tax=Tachypleus tridentatus TaxID=6853 RepID=UPI003FD09A60